MSGQTIAIIAPGDMGHAVGGALKEHGHRPITCLAGRDDGNGLSAHVVS